MGGEGGLCKWEHSFWPCRVQTGSQTPGFDKGDDQRIAWNASRLELGGVSCPINFKGARRGNDHSGKCKPERDSKGGLPVLLSGPNLGWGRVYANIEESRERSSIKEGKTKPIKGFAECWNGVEGRKLNEKRSTGKGGNPFKSFFQ